MSRVVFERMFTDEGSGGFGHAVTALGMYAMSSHVIQLMQTGNGDAQNEEASQYLLQAMQLAH